MAMRAELARRRTLRGFTLIEVMLALLIFGISGTALIAGISQIVNQHERLEEKTFGGWIAANKVAELQIVGKMPSIGSSKEDVEFANREWQVSTTVKATPNPFMRRIEVSVTTRKGNLREVPVTNLTSFIGDL